MEERTRAYLRGRFGDYYRRTDLEAPPGGDAREWGYIPWTAGGGTTMVRHKSLLDLGDLGAFLERERPRHAYFSAGRYADPGAGTMGEKGWRESDLVFDLDADHLPGVDPDEASYAEMLAACKDALRRLLDLLESDFAFEDLTVVFSGGRGYHVHVRDQAVRGLGREARREVVDYVRGIGLDDVRQVASRELVSGMGMESTPEKWTLETRGGWGRRTHENLLAYVDELRDLEEDEALQRLQSFEGIGPGRSEAILRAVRENDDQIRRGNLEAGGNAAIKRLAERFLERTIEAEGAPIDEPVTTDINRLIRLPGSLHGGTGLRVLPIPRDDLDAFDPLTDAVPETFVGHDIRVEVTDPPDTVELMGDSFTLREGDTSVPEHVGVFLMSGGHAEKAKE